MYPHSLVVYQHVVDTTPPDRPARVTYVGWRVVLFAAAAGFWIGFKLTSWL